jgi:hypothetical protein
MFWQVFDPGLEGFFLCLDSCLSRLKRYPLEPLDLLLCRRIGYVLNNRLRCHNRLLLYLTRLEDVPRLIDQSWSRFALEAEVDSLGKHFGRSSLVLGLVDQVLKALAIHGCQ